MIRPKSTAVRSAALSLALAVLPACGSMDRGADTDDGGGVLEFGQAVNGTVSEADLQPGADGAQSAFDVWVICLPMGHYTIRMCKRTESEGHLAPALQVYTGVWPPSATTRLLGADPGSTADGNARLRLWSPGDGWVSVLAADQTGRPPSTDNSHPEWGNYRLQVDRGDDPDAGCPLP